MNLKTIVDTRREAAIRAWIRDPMFVIQVADPAMFGSPEWLAIGQGAEVSKLGRRALGNTAIVKRPGAATTDATVWSAKRYDDYRPAFKAFVKEVYGATLPDAEFADYDIDHLLSRGQVQQASYFLRLEACPRDINQLWGALYEKAAARPDIEANKVRAGRKMRWTIASKLAAQPPPSGPDDAAGIRRLATYWTRWGFPYEQAEHALKDDLAFIFGRPRGGVVTPTTRWL